MARRDFRTAPKDPAAGRKPGRSTLIILLLGITLGVGLTLALTHWLAAEPDKEEPAPKTKAPATKHLPPPKPSPTPVQSVSPSPKAPVTHAAPVAPVVPAAPAPKPAAATPPVRASAPVTPPPTPATPPASQPADKASNFHDLLVKGKTPTIVPPLKPREIWWLQVAALRKEEDARRLRARLLLLNLDVVITPSDDGATYRVRVGPYKTEALAREKEGLLSRNNLVPRLVKEPVFPSNP